MVMIGTGIKIVREVRGRRVADLAAKAGLSRQALYKIEGGEDASLATLHRIADELGVPLSVLFILGEDSQEPWVESMKKKVFDAIN